MLDCAFKNLGGVRFELMGKVKKITYQILDGRNEIIVHVAFHLKRHES